MGPSTDPHKVLGRLGKEQKHRYLETYAFQTDQNNIQKHKNNSGPYQKHIIAFLNDKTPGILRGQETEPTLE